MINSITSAGGNSEPVLFPKRQSAQPRDLKAGKSDSVRFGAGGPVSSGDALQIVTERALEKLRAVVDDARAQLGLSDDDTASVFDTSPEATANRIADFALNFFDKYAKNNNLENDEAGRKQFSDFIGGAISQGIEEARGILTSLNVLTGDVGTNIDTTASIIQKRLDDFVKNGPKSNTPQLT